MVKKILILSFLFFLGMSFKAHSQLEQLQNICALYFPPEFISDGQQYFAPLKPEQDVEFRTTFYGDNTYRIVACTNAKKGDLLFSVYDTEKNLLFTNSAYDKSPYWNFKFKSTVSCIIRIKVDAKRFQPGYVMLLIGYQQRK